MRLALTAGGTGGHIFPALAVYEAARERFGPALEVAFFGPEDRGERQLIEARGIPFHVVPAGQVRGRGPRGLARTGWRLGRGVFAAVRSLRRFRADVVFSTGGYGSFPCSVAARILRRPLVVYLPDVSPGWAVRAETRLATVMATTTEAALAHLPRKKTRVTGYPVRPAFFARTKQEARAALGLPAEAPIVLVAGASQGATAINEAVFSALDRLTESAIVLHVTGQAGIAEAEAQRHALGLARSARYHPAAFRDDLPTVMVAADLAVMRAGASVLGELPAAKLPALLVPGTFAGGHQRDNARWLADHGAAEILEEEHLGELAERVEALVRAPERLAAMRDAAAALARPSASADIVRILEEVAR